MQNSQNPKVNQLNLNKLFCSIKIRLFFKTKNEFHYQKRFLSVKCFNKNFSRSLMIKILNTQIKTNNGNTKM